MGDCRFVSLVNQVPDVVRGARQGGGMAHGKWMFFRKYGLFLSRQALVDGK